MRDDRPGWNRAQHSGAASRVVPWLLTIIVGHLTGCAFDSHKQVEVLSEPPGARIEVNGDFIGCAPTKIQMLGEPDGQVQMDYTIRAYPPGPEYYPQAKVFLKRESGESDRIPMRIYFDMRVRQPADSGSNDAPKQRRPWP